MLGIPHKDRSCASGGAGESGGAPEQVEAARPAPLMDLVDLPRGSGDKVTRGSRVRENKLHAISTDRVGLEASLPVSAPARAGQPALRLRRRVDMHVS